jgi:hypothetical protein
MRATVMALCFFVGMTAAHGQSLKDPLGSRLADARLACQSDAVKSSTNADLMNACDVLLAPGSRNPLPTPDDISRAVDTVEGNVAMTFQLK